MKAGYSIASIQSSFAKARGQFFDVLTGLHDRLVVRLRHVAVLRRALHGRERYAGAAVVVLVHVIAIWIFVSGLRLQTVPPPEHEITLAVYVPGAQLSPAPAKKQPDFVDPQAVTVPPPDVTVAPDARAPAAVTGASVSMLLAPRPDPAQFNAAPDMPAPHKNLLGEFFVILKVLVRTDGSIETASVTKSSGMSDLDIAAIDYIKQRWRFIPAMLAGKPVQDWTTVRVPFKTSQS